MKKFLNWLKSPSSDFALFIILLILANFVGHNAFARFDLTGPKSYSLSKASKTLVKNLEEPLSVRVFFDENLPAPYNSVEQYVKDMLSEYKGAANNKFNVTYMDMSKDANVELAGDYGLRQIQIQEVKNNEVGFKQGYMGIVIAYGDNIDLMDQIISTDGFEYKFTSKVSKMINTADTLAGLNNGDKINLTLYLSSPLKNMRISNCDQMEKIIRAAFDEVNKKNMNHLTFNVVSPSSDDAKSISEKYGLQLIGYQNAKGEKENGTLGLVLEYGDNFRVLPIQIQQSFFGYGIAGLDTVSEDISDSLQSLLSKVTEIGYITGHNELDHLDETYSANFDKLISGMYSLVDIDLSEKDIPAGMNSIIINGPQFDYTEEELYKVDQFLMRGGNLLFFVDPLNQDGTSQYYGTQSYVPNTLNLDRLLEKYGITRGYNYVMDKNCYVNTNQQYGKLNLYWAPVLQKNQLAKKNPITSNLGYVIMLQAGSVDVSAAEADKNVKATVLAKSSNDAWTVDKDIVLNPVMCVPPSDTSRFKSEDLVVMLEGKFNSAFDEAVAMTQYDEEGNEIELPEGELETTNYISKSLLPGKIIFFGTSYVTTRQLIDESGSNPIAMLLLNAVDYLNGNEDLCKMRTKGLSVNTLQIKSKGAAQFWKFFNQFGLVVILLIVAVLVWRMRSKRRRAINKRYNPDDTRTIEKKSEKKAEKKSEQIDETTETTEVSEQTESGEVVEANEFQDSEDKSE